MNSICQRCGAAGFNWTIAEARFDVGRVSHWKVQLCPACTDRVEKAVREALQPPAKAT